MVIEISKYLTGALQWDEVVGIVVSRVRLDAWPILRGLHHIAWELCLVAMSTIGTILDLGLMLCKLVSLHYRHSPQEQV